jgi:hypothetical protein
MYHFRNLNDRWICKPLKKSKQRITWEIKTIDRHATCHDMKHS